MVLPLSLLKNSVDQNCLVELKTGETFTGTIKSVDGFMNMQLVDANKTNKSGDKFWSVNECYIRGNCVKYLRLVESTLKATEHSESKTPPAVRGGRSRGRARGRARGRGAGGGRGGMA
eukprot:GHVH01017501.1.p1 GENE.GHVH01017501.1~~GHVH01017501.1.p1  ORF type:complete len:118 (+),score=18.20 GHVH01017501.1:81-434(+)